MMRPETAARLDRVLSMYAAGKSLAVIAESEGIRSSALLGYLSYGRRIGDLRAAPRRIIPSRQRALFLDALVAGLASGEGVTLAEFKELLWPGEGRLPSTWRSILSVLATRARAEGHKIKFDGDCYMLIGGPVSDRKRG